MSELSSTKTHRLFTHTVCLHVVEPTPEVTKHGNSVSEIDVSEDEETATNVNTAVSAVMYHLTRFFNIAAGGKWRWGAAYDSKFRSTMTLAVQGYRPYNNVSAYFFGPML